MRIFGLHIVLHGMYDRGQNNTMNICQKNLHAYFQTLPTTIILQYSNHFQKRPLALEKLDHQRAHAFLYILQLNMSQSAMENRP